MPYGPKSQEVLNALTSYLRSPTVDLLERFQAALQKTNEESLMETDTSGNSLLNHLFSLPSKLLQNQASSSPLINRLFQLIMEKVRDSHRAKAFLLTSSNHNGLNPFYQVLALGHPENMRMYLDTVKEAVPKIIPTELYKNLLKGKIRKQDFNPLYSALKARNSPNLNDYLREAKRALTHQEYGWLLTSASVNCLNPLLNGLTPLYHALKSESPEILTLYLTAVKKEVPQIISDETYRFLLIGNIKENTPLSIALQTGNFDIVLHYLNAIEKALEDRIITPDDYAHLLTQPNPLDFVGRNSDNMHVYLETLKQAVREKIVPKDVYARLLTHVNKFGSSPFMQTLTFGNNDNLRMFLGTIKEALHTGILTEGDYVQSLTQSNHAGITPLHYAIRSGYESTKTYLNAINEHRSLIKEEVYKNLLTHPGPDPERLTPLQQAAKNGSLNVFSRLVEELETLFEPHEVYQFLEGVPLTPSNVGINRYLQQKKDALHAALPKESHENRFFSSFPGEKDPGIDSDFLQKNR